MQTTNDPNCNIDVTLTHLTKDLTSEAEKARAIFTWISRLLFVKAKTVNKDETTLAGLLNLIASGERTWSDVFALLCRYAYSNCVLVHNVVHNVVHNGDILQVITVQF